MNFLFLTACLKCGADATWLRKLETLNVIGNNESANPVVVCANCGSLMVRIGGLRGEPGWALHPSLDANVIFDSGK